MPLLPALSLNETSALNAGEKKQERKRVGGVETFHSIACTSVQPGEKGE